jgi:hypothetical protein
LWEDPDHYQPFGIRSNSGSPVRALVQPFFSTGPHAIVPAQSGKTVFDTEK